MDTVSASAINAHVQKPAMYSVTMHILIPTVADFRLLVSFPLSIMLEWAALWGGLLVVGLLVLTLSMCQTASITCEVQPPPHFLLLKLLPTSWNVNHAPTTVNPQGPLQAELSKDELPILQPPLWKWHLLTAVLPCILRRHTSML